MLTGDLLPFFEKEWNTGYEADFIELSVEKGNWSEKEAKLLFDQQVKEGNILVGPDGFWGWMH